jgi:hypothetical protein
VGVYDYKKQQDCSFTYLHQELLDQVKTEGKVKHGHVYVGGREKEREREREREREGGREGGREREGGVCVYVCVCKKHYSSSAI